MWDNFIIPAPRFPGSTGIRRHYTLQPPPDSTPPTVTSAPDTASAQPHANCYRACISAKLNSVAAALYRP